MKATINPGWLVSLMSRWAVRQLRVENSSLGYPQKACGFSEKTTGGYSHSDPVGFGFEDFRDLDAVLVELNERHDGQFAAMVMYYKPWVVNSMIADGWPFNNSTYYKRLHAAHSYVSTKLDDMRVEVE